MEWITLLLSSATPLVETVMVMMAVMETMVMTVTTLTSTALKLSGGTLVSKLLKDPVALATGLSRTPGVLVGVNKDMANWSLLKVLVLLAPTAMLPHQTLIDRKH